MSGLEAGANGLDLALSLDHKMTRRSAFGDEKGCSNSARTTLNIAVTEPMPSASINTATPANQGSWPAGTLQIENP
jgi:hypothetical protein